MNVNAPLVTARAKPPTNVKVSLQLLEIISLHRSQCVGDAYGAALELMLLLLLAVSC